MQKSYIVFLTVCVGFVMNCSVYAGCSFGMKSCYQHYKDDVPSLVGPPEGCNRLKILIKNDTHYYFNLDQSASGSGVSLGNILNGTNSTQPPVIQPSVDTTMMIEGVSNTVTGDQDDVDKNLRFIAYFEDPVENPNAKPVGANFVVHVSKSSCNASLTTCTKKDNPCYCKGGNKGDPCVDTFYQCLKMIYPDDEKYNRHDGGGAMEPYHSTSSYWKKSASNCDRAAPSSTYKTTVDTVSKTAVYLSSLINEPPAFSCNNDTVCSASSNGNTAGIINFTINPAQIETLTVAFPFNTQTPTAKILKDSIYNNLNAESLGRLGSYFSFSPVVVEDKTIAFSTLCNSANCP